MSIIISGYYSNYILESLTPLPDLATDRLQASDPVMNRDGHNILLRSDQE
jgi:hypothetical protein